MQRYRLDLFGPFGLFDPIGRRIELSSKKGVALLALLATARGGVRTRGWVQDMLWGARAPAQAQASVRRELSNLRSILNSGSTPLLETGFGRITLDLDHIELVPPDSESGEFLEGLDIAGEDGFEDWLRTKRNDTASVETQLPRADRARAPVIADDPFLRSAAVAILPFANLTGARDYDYLTDAIAEELINLLSRQRWIPVIAQSTSATYSSERQTLQEIGRELGAGFIVEGRLRGSGDAIGLAASIADANDGRIIWAMRVEFPTTTKVADIDAMLTDVVGGLSSHVDDFEMRRVMTVGQPLTATSDLLWRARWHHNQFTREGTAIAAALFEEAMAKEPHSSEAIIQYAMFKQRQVWFSRGGPDDIRNLRRLAQRAIAADYSDGRGYLIAGLADLWTRNIASAMALFRQAISLNPSLAYAYAQLGAAHYLNGEPEAALEMLNRSLRLDFGEIYGFYVMSEIAMARAMLGQWRSAIDAADQSISRRPHYWYAHVIKIYSLMASGETRSAHHARNALHRAHPTFTVDFIGWLPFADSRWNDELCAALDAAAAPDG